MRKRRRMVVTEGEGEDASTKPVWTPESVPSWR
jgi:hypothetical protein